MPITLDEDIAAIARAPGLWLPPRRGGRPPHASCLFRWAKGGLRGVRLETMRVGGTLCTSKQALERFFARLAELDSPAEIPADGQREIRDSPSQGGGCSRMNNDRDRGGRRPAVSCVWPNVRTSSMNQRTTKPRRDEGPDLGSGDASVQDGVANEKVAPVPSGDKLTLDGPDVTDGPTVPTNGQPVSNGQSSTESSDPNPFDPARYRLGTNYAEMLGFRTHLLAVPVRKPGNEAFFRVHPTNRLETAVVEVGGDTGDPGDVSS